MPIYYRLFLKIKLKYYMDCISADSEMMFLYDHNDLKIQDVSIGCSMNLHDELWMMKVSLYLEN